MLANGLGTGADRDGDRHRVGNLGQVTETRGHLDQAVGNRARFAALI
jgi:hypothetical protein